MCAEMRPAEEPLQKDYDFLLTVFPNLAKFVDISHWVAFNQYRDQGLGFTEIAELTKMPLETVKLLENPRRCLYKWDHNPEKVKDCIEGKIDP